MLGELIGCIDSRAFLFWQHGVVLDLRRLYTPNRSKGRGNTDQVCG